MEFDLKNRLELFANADYKKPVEDLSAWELHNTVAKAVLSGVSSTWQNCEKLRNPTRRAYYFSAEYLVGRLIFNNLFCLGLTNTMDSILKTYGRSLNDLEVIEDNVLGNGGLGRLAACFLDSAANLKIALDGYGIRYKCGIFRQKIEDGFQKEISEDWTRFGDAWSVRKYDEKVQVDFTDFSVWAVPYDMAVIGYNNGYVGTLRLFECEPMRPMDFASFAEQEYDECFKEVIAAENISRVMYPNDTKREGKLLRLRQQYFLASASLKDILRRHKSAFGTLDNISSFVSIQLNDTHPVIAIPEFIRLMIEEGYTFDNAFLSAAEIFNYTNHTLMSEALEKWDEEYIKAVSSDTLEIITRINERFLLCHKPNDNFYIIRDGRVNMAYLAAFVAKNINGVARIHTELLKKSVLLEWYNEYPQKFSNKTNGITPRRWLGLSNKGLYNLLCETLEGRDILHDLDCLKALETYADDTAFLDKLYEIKQHNKQILCEFLKHTDGIEFDTTAILDVQIKRLHEYKRQLLNILCILELYFEIKSGELPTFRRTVFLFGAKAASGYRRAKAIIKLINEVGKLIENDEQVRQYIKVIFVPEYDVTKAEKIIAAADVSEQISTAGTEASGTGNMKLMLNGAITLGTLDGANIEIVESAGEENAYIFGNTVEEINKLKPSYNPQKIYKENPKIKRVLDALVDGTLDDGKSGYFKELYDSILLGAEWHEPDCYFLLADFDDYLKTKIKINHDFSDKYKILKKSLYNIANAGYFSSDRTVREYADEIWKVYPQKT